MSHSSIHIIKLLSLLFKFILLQSLREIEMFETGCGREKPANILAKPEVLATR